MRKRVLDRLDQTIVYLYRNLRPAFPIHAVVVAKRLEHCRFVTYDELARMSGTSYEEVMRACRSVDGSTHYDPEKKRYLIAVNLPGRHILSRARVNWTIAHELGHIAAGHFTELLEQGCANPDPSASKEMEQEADYFAATLLAPFSAIRALGACSAEDIRDWFGLSGEAAEYRWREYREGGRDSRTIERYFERNYVQSSVKEDRRRAAFHPAGKPIQIQMDSTEEL